MEKRKKMKIKKKILAQGAEAKIILLKENKETFVIKDRIKKSYRINFLDEKLRKKRTKAEIKLLKKAAEIIKCPAIKEEEIYKIKMEFIEGKKLSDNLDDFPIEKQKRIFKKIGASIAKLHSRNIIHGDLTTSNIISKEKEIYIIDFGLGFISDKIEDKAVDLHLLKQALEAKHFKNSGVLFKIFLKEYSKNYESSNQVLERLKAVEKRGRYK